MYDDELRDRRAEATVGAGRNIGAGFRRLERCDVVLRPPGRNEQKFERDVLRSGPVVGVLPVDLARDRLVLIRQFRAAAALALDVGDMVEIVAGRQDAGETLVETVMRECGEEIGVRPHRLVEILRFMPAPALTDEVMTLFLAEVDAGALPQQAGLAEEHEFIRPFSVPIDVAARALADGMVLNGPLLIGLHWLRANRDRLPALLGSD